MPRPSETPPWHEVQIELTAETAHASPYTDVEVWANFTLR